MFGMDAIVEQRIRDAMVRGEFDNLPNAGRPIALDDDVMVPAELKMAYRVLKNAGVVPEQVTLKAEIIRLNEVALQDDLAAAKDAKMRLGLVLTRLEMAGVISANVPQAVAQRAMDSGSTPTVTADLSQS